MHYEVKADGSFDVLTSDYSVLNCYPAIDHEPIRALEIEIAAGTDSHQVVYRLTENRHLVLTLSARPSGMQIDCQLSGFLWAPHWVHPLSSGRLDRVQRIFRQGIGFSGPTGFVNLTAEPDHFSYESYLVTALVGADESTLAIAAHDHHNFLQKTHVETRLHRRQFRNREIDRKQIYLEAGFSTEKIPLPESKLILPALHFHFGAHPWQTMRETASQIAIASKVRLRHPPCYHWCSWYDRGPFFTHAELTAFLNGIDQLEEKPKVVQIDDGYAPSKGDWLLTNANWPSGMGPVFSEILSHGITPGIWIAPFMVGSRSQLAKQHRDWLLRDAQGNPHADWKNYDGTANDEETYVLDSSHPEALAYIEHVFRTFRQAGARFFKTDFLEWGYKDSTCYQRHTPGKTSAQYFHDVMQTIRNAIGEESHWLGCISYFAPCIGFVDSMRVSSDVGPEWSSHGGTGNDGVGGGIENMLMETHATQYLNQILWQNDPDVTFLRKHHMRMTESDITALAYWNGILGGSVNTSDRLDLLPEDRLALWNFLKPADSASIAAMPFWSHSGSIYVASRAYPDQEAWALLFINHTSRSAVNSYRLSDIIPFDSAHFYLWGHRESRLLGARAEWIEQLEPHSARLYYVTANAQPPPPTLSLGGAHLARALAHG